ncbi:MAG: FHA domain-containing protein, partial [Deltaproteobacteria bacterium]|nr:FHA domain-containing protein [Deltaproteobacteria bacterium]
SKNGTFLNDERLAPGQRSAQPLKHGDRLRFNMVEFEFIIPEESV